jgi:hypothetical protein
LTTTSPDGPAEPILIAIAQSYDELLAALNLRRQQLGLTMEVLDEICGLARGHSGKIFGARRIKGLGSLSLLLLLGGLDCELAIVPRTSNRYSVAKGNDRQEQERARATGVLAGAPGP